MDDSDLDDLYFVDQCTYNCAFCKRRNVHYLSTGRFKFDWTATKQCFGYLFLCSSCSKLSMHLSFTELNKNFFIPDKGLKGYVKPLQARQTLNQIFFLSVPSSSFSVDHRIPAVLRDLVMEAEGCLKGNFLTGSSACVRKVIYELSQRKGAEGDDYEQRIKSLKEVDPLVPAEYFDTLVTLQQVTSTKVHENAYDGWESKHLRVILATLYEILREIYVVPEERKLRRQSVLALRDELVGGDDTQKE